jgi:hypothetical protein
MIQFALTDQETQENNSVWVASLWDGIRTVDVTDMKQECQPLNDALLLHFPFTFPLTSSMKQIPYGEAGSRSTSEDIPNRLWNPKIHHLVHSVQQKSNVWDFKFSRRRVWCSELSSGMYCCIKWLSTDVSEVRTASIIRWHPSWIEPSSKSQ